MNPLAAIYEAGVKTKNALYDRGILTARALSAPVISVGSISAGGAGKTPFVILLGELLKERGITFNVLSRGYGRKTRGVLIVDEKGDSRTFGDEPMLIARRLGCPVIVGESRYEAGLVAEQRFDSQVHILDDGFQHRRLARNFDIVLLTTRELDDQPLPTGRLREPLTSLRRADAVVLCGEIDSSRLPPGIKELWRVRRAISLKDAPPEPIVFCGIARSDDFLAQVKKLGVVPKAFKSFSDHHQYSAEDVRRLIELRDQSAAGGFITTEKDAINLGAAISQLAPVAVAKVEMELAAAADVLDTMLRVVALREGRREKIRTDSEA